MPIQYRRGGGGLHFTFFSKPASRSKAEQLFKRGNTDKEQKKSKKGPPDIYRSVHPKFKAGAAQGPSFRLLSVATRKTFQENCPQCFLMAHPPTHPQASVIVPELKERNSSAHLKRAEIRVQVEFVIRESMRSTQAFLITGPEFLTFLSMNIGLAVRITFFQL